MRCILILSILFFASCDLGSQGLIELYNESQVNTAFHEFSPSSFRNQILFVNSHKNTKSIDPINKASYFDLKFAGVDTRGRMIGSAFLPKEINSSFHEGPCTYDSENDILYFTRTDTESGLNSKYERLPLQIYKAEYKENKWENIQKWEIVQDSASFCHPAISKDGKTLIFSSDLGNTTGKMDLFRSDKRNGLWSSPKRLDSIVNSSKNEVFPFIHPGGYLFFASDGLSEGQGFDIFVTKLYADSIGSPKLLPVPLNSNFDDFGFYTNEKGDQGYISSNRPGGAGLDDIYSFKANSPLFELLYKTKKQAPKETEPIVEKKTEAVPEEPKPRPKPVLPAVSIDTVIGAVTVFDNIYYDLNSYRIKEGAARELDALAQLMLTNANIKVQLSAHTDSRGSESFNQELSDKRAISARNYLINKGVESYRIFVIGFGESRLRNRCREGVDCTEEEHKYNRRTEVTILDN